MRLPESSFKHVVLASAFFGAVGMCGLHFYSNSVHAHLYIHLKNSFHTNAKSDLQLQTRKIIEIQKNDFPSYISVILAGALYGVVLGSAVYGVKKFIKIK